MRDADRFRLLGRYTTPRVKLGTVLSCEARDCDVIVVGYSDGRIPWPIGRRKGTSARGLVLYGDLAAAVKRESHIAIRHWWGVGASTVWTWRKALGVELSNEGTHRLRSDYTEEEWAKEALKKAQGKSGDPKRRAKIAAHRRGKPRPRHVIQAMRQGRKGKPQPDSFRQRITEVMRERSKLYVINGRAWTAEEDELVRTLPAAEVARRTERTLTSVYSRRDRLLGKRREQPA